MYRRTDRRTDEQKHEKLKNLRFSVSDCLLVFRSKRSSNIKESLIKIDRFLRIFSVYYVYLYSQRNCSFQKCRQNSLLKNISAVQLFHKNMCNRIHYKLGTEIILFRYSYFFFNLGLSYKNTIHTNEIKKNLNY